MLSENIRKTGTNNLQMHCRAVKERFPYEWKNASKQ